MSDNLLQFMFVFLVVLLIIMFKGDPDIHDAIIKNLMAECN